MESIQESKISEDIYQNKKISLVKIFIVLNFLFFLGLFLNFPLKTIIVSKTLSAINTFSTPSCPIKVDDLEIEMFLPKVILKQVSMGASCFPSNTQGITFSNIPVYFRGPSIYPLGIKLLTELKIGSDVLSVHKIISGNNVIVSIKDNQLDFKNISPYIPKILRPVQIDFVGKLEIDTIINYENNKLKFADFRIESSNFNILPFEYLGTKINNLKLDNILIQGSATDKGQIIDVVLDTSDQSEKKARGITLGGPDKSLTLNMKGSLQINKQNAMQSNLNLIGELKLSNDLEKMIPGLDVLLGAILNKKGDSYPIQLRGTLGQPSLSGTNL